MQIVLLVWDPTLTNAKAALPTPHYLEQHPVLVSATWDTSVTPPTVSSATLHAKAVQQLEALSALAARFMLLCRTLPLLLVFATLDMREALHHVNSVTLLVKHVRVQLLLQIVRCVNRMLC
jgi:hypothetical protein